MTENTYFFAALLNVLYHTSANNFRAQFFCFRDFCKVYQGPFLAILAIVVKDSLYFGIRIRNLSTGEVDPSLTNGALETYNQVYIINDLHSI